MFRLKRVGRDEQRYATKMPSGSETYLLRDHRSFKHRNNGCVVSHVIDFWKMAA